MEAAEVVEDDIQAMPLDVLHCVVVNSPILAHPVDRHDVPVVQPRRRPRLQPEPLDLHRVDPAVQRQDLQRHAAAERLLDGLVDHPHAALADLADDPVIAQLLRARRRCGGEPAVERGGAVALAGLESLHTFQGGEELEDLLGVLGVPAGVFGGRGILAAPSPIEELGGQPLQRIAVRG